MTGVGISLKLFVLAPDIAAQVTVHEPTPPTGSYTDFDYDALLDGAIANITNDMLIVMTKAGVTYGRTRHRFKAPVGTTSGVIYPGWSSSARTEGGMQVVNDATATFYEVYRPWTRNPYIDEDSGTHYMDFNRDFATYGAMQPVIVLGCGPATQQPLSGGVATFAFDASGTYVTDPDATTISTWAWTLPSGASVTGGGTNQDNVTFTLAQGSGYVTLVATDDNGTAATRYVYVIAGEPSGTIDAFDNAQIIRNRQGQTLTLRLNEALDPATYPDGTLAVLWAEQTEDGVAATRDGLSGHEHIMFVGWLHQEDVTVEARESGTIDDTTLTFWDVNNYLRALPSYPIIMKNDSSPATWTEMKSANTDRYVVRLLSEMTNVLTLTDFAWSGQGASYFPFPTLSSEGQTFYEQVEWVSKACLHTFTCDQWGRLAMTPDPQRLDETGGTNTPFTRTTTVQKAITEALWSTLTYTYNWLPAINWDWASGITAASDQADDIESVTAVFCVAPGKAPSQGMSQRQTGQQLVVTQADLNARIGHDYARDTSTYPAISLTLTSPDDYAIQPAYMQWVTFTNSTSSDSLRSRLWSTGNLLPREMTLAHDAERGLMTVTLSCEQETVGQPAETVIKPANENLSDYYGAYDYYPFDYTLDGLDAYGMNKGVDQLFLAHASGEESQTSDFDTPAVTGGPDYDISDLSLDGTVLGMVTDAFSPKYLGSGTTVNAWIVTTTRLYYVADIANVSSRSVTSKHTFATSSSYRALATERGTQNWVVVASYYQGIGTKALYSTDNSSFSEVVIASDTGSATGSIANWTSLTQIASTGMHGTFSGSFNGASMTVSWTRDGDNFEDSGLRAFVSLPATVSQIKWRAKRNELNPTASDEWTLPGNSYANLEGLLYPVIAGTTTDLGNDGTWAYFQRDASTPGPITYFQHAGGGWRGNPNPTGFESTNTVTFEIYEIDGGGVAIEEPAAPAVYVSGKTPGLVYVTAFSSYGVGDLYVSTDYGATWALASTPDCTPGDYLGGCLHFPWDNNPNENIMYYGGLSSSAYALYRTSADGLSSTDITPSGDYGPVGPRAISTCATNRNIVVACLTNYSTGYSGVFRSENGGDTWTTLIAPSADGYTGVHVADDPDVIYVWGSAGIAFSGNAGLLWDDRTGDASTSEVLGIGGW